VRSKNDSVVKALLDEMGYHDPVRCCSTCVHYRESDCSGNHNAEAEHCELNPALHLPIDGAGWCRHHVAKTDGIRTFANVGKAQEAINAMRDREVPSNRTPRDEIG